MGLCGAYPIVLALCGVCCVCVCVCVCVCLCVCERERDLVSVCVFIQHILFKALN